LAAIASSICALHEVPRTAFGLADPAADHIVGMGPGQASTVVKVVKSWMAKERQMTRSRVSRQRQRGIVLSRPRTVSDLR